MRKKVSFQGELGSYSHQALLEIILEISLNISLDDDVVIVLILLIPIECIVDLSKSNPPAYFEKSFELPEDVKNPLKVFPDINFHYMSDQEREQKKLRFLSSIDQNFKQSEKDIEELQATSINKQKELHEKYNTN